MYNTQHKIASAVNERIGIELGNAAASGLRVIHDLANFLRASAAPGNSSRPGQRFIPRRHLNDRKPTYNRLGLRERSLRTGTVGRDNGRLLA